MMNMKTRKIKSITETCIYCIGYSTMGFLLLTLGFALTVAFCHLFGLDTSWASNIL